VGVVGVGGRVRLVADEDHGLAAGAQDRGDVLVETRHPGADIDHEDAEVSLLDGDPRLLLGAPGQLGDARVLGDQGGVEAGGVHQGEAAPAPLGHPVQAIPGEPGGLIDDGVPLPGQPVEEGRLPDIGPADDGDDAAHRAQGGVVAVPAAAPVAD
jgi:hypothetical protein